LSSEYDVSIHSGFSSILASLVSSGLSKRNKTTIQITKGRTKTYALDNSDLWFEEAARLYATHVWIERAVDQGRNIYMIVGLHTITTEPGMAVQQQGPDGSRSQFTVPGQQICALEYRKLTHKWLSRNHMKNIQLSTKVCQWQTMEKARDGGDSEEKTTYWKLN
jgi:hypothetical protein